MIQASADVTEPRHVRGSVFAAIDIQSRRGDSPLGKRDAWNGPIAILLALAFATAALVALSGTTPRSDEIFHFEQIRQFLTGQLHGPDTHLSTIPGYHALVAAVMWVVRQDSLGTARLITALIGLTAVAAFHRLRSNLWSNDTGLAAAQLVALPILVPFFFLVYTDALALALVLWATVAAFGGRHWLAVGLLSVDIFVRQTDVVWAGLLALLCFWPLLRASGLKALPAVVAKSLPYAIPVAIFIGYWAWHGSITWSPLEAPLHPELTLRLGNIGFAVLLAGLLLPLQVVEGVGRFTSKVRTNPWLIGVPLVAFAVFWFGFHADNPYNNALPQVYPRNRLLIAIDQDPWWRAAAGFWIALSVCGLGSVRLAPMGAAWLYPLSGFFLASSWLIDQRYMLVPFVLWLAFREQSSVTVERSTLALWLVIAVALFAAIAGGRILP
ncbi:MAG: hypothetical protein ABIR62_01380 [Dokdonella sp.]|uniref:hypothetical protein n=1 Tax=Dokdonella sp. TaxID=2291710 RepID=UPI003264360C